MVQCMNKIITITTQAMFWYSTMIVEYILVCL